MLPKKSMKRRVLDQRFRHLDAAESIWTVKQLERVKANAYEVQVPEQRIREFIPTGNGGLPPGTKAFSYKIYDVVGVAKIIAAYSDDLPRVDAFAKEELGRIRPLGDSYGYSILEDVQPSAARNEDLSGRKANAARRAVEQKISDIGLSGDASYNLLGLLNQPNVSVYVVPNGAGGVATWMAGVGKTADEILDDMYAMEDTPSNATKGIAKPSILLMPPEQFRYIARTRLDPSAETTILDYFLRTSKSIKQVEGWDDLNSAGAGGTDRMVSFRKDPEVLELLVTREFQQLDPEQRNLELLINCVAETGGVVVYYPLEVTYADGI